MAFPSQDGTKQQSLSVAWGLARNLASNLKSSSQSMRAQAASGATSGAILDYVTFLANANAQLAGVASVSGLGAYAQEQIADPTFDVVASFLAMTSALNATVAWIITNFPKDANGFLLRATFTADNSGRQTDRVFSAATLATFVTVLDAFIATID